jgi:hypothetical protein
VVELQHYVELEDMVHMAIKVERQLKRKGTRSFQNPGSSTSWKSNWRKDEGAVLKSKTDTGIKKDVPTKMELVRKPKLITRLIGGWLDIYVFGIRICE